MPLASPTVLVVDDNEALRGVVRDVLEGAGYAVLEAVDAASALETAARHPVQLLLTDLVLPGMDGVALAQRLRVARPGVRVLYMSGQLGDSVTGPARPTGFLAKPFTAAALEDAVRTALADRQPPPR
jgi:CheY-like chemotaxis protein